MSGWLTEASLATRDRGRELVEAWTSTALPGIRRAWRPVATAASRLPRVTTRAVDSPPGAGSVALSYTLSLASAFVLALLIQVTLVSQFQHFTSQSSLYSQLRLQLAEGSLPIGQTDVDGKVTTLGSPIALLTIPELGVREVIVEGSASAETATGVGHRRDTPLPGQAGESVLLGRAAAYGGVFSSLDTLAPGSVFTVTTGQGVSKYRVIGVHDPKEKPAALQSGEGRLTLTTASGTRFMPSGVTRVDAELITPAFTRPTPVMGVGFVNNSEAPMGSDTSGLFGLSWLAELFVVLVVAATWAWKRWPRRTVWVIFAPTLFCTQLAITGQIAMLLPNIL